MNKYCGNNRLFIYVMYPNGKSEQAMRDMEKLSEAGLSFWFADEFTAAEKKHLEAACGVLLYVDNELINEEHFREAVDRTVHVGKNVQCVRLEKLTEMTPWAHMQLDSQQRVNRYSYENEDDYFEKLKSSVLFSNTAISSRQKSIRRNQTFTLAALAVIAAASLFAFYIYPTFIKKPPEPPEPEVSTTDIPEIGLYGLTEEDFANMEYLHIGGDRTFTTDPADALTGLYGSRNDHKAYTSSIRINTMGSGPFENDTRPAGKLKDFTIIEKFPNLRRLSLVGQQATDLTPVFTLTKLRGLYISGTPVESIEGIENLKVLDEIYMNQTEVKDLSPIVGCRNLTSMYISESTENPEVIYDMQKLVLVQTDAYIESFEGIENMKELRYFYLCNQRTTDDFTPLLNCPNLRVVQFPDIIEVPGGEAGPVVMNAMKEQLQKEAPFRIMSWSECNAFRDIGAEAREDELFWEGKSTVEVYEIISEEFAEQLEENNIPYVRPAYRPNNEVG